VGARFEFNSDAIAIQHWNKTFRELARETVTKGRTAVALAHKHPRIKPELRLAGYSQTTTVWRLARACLLAASRVPGFPDLVSILTLFLERVRFPRMHAYYVHVLDYFYWLGVRAALSDRGYHAPLQTAIENWPAHEPDGLPVHR
jgi:hypothetical protein